MMALRTRRISCGIGCSRTPSASPERRTCPACPDGDNYDAGIGVQIRAIGGGNTGLPFERALFVVGRYVGNTMSDEWTVQRIMP